LAFGRVKKKRAHFKQSLDFDLDNYVLRKRFSGKCLIHFKFMGKSNHPSQARTQLQPIGSSSLLVQQANG
jgi:hypothetical protein